eukprot:4363248-Pyramimonas_sp.AAC.1
MALATAQSHGQAPAEESASNISIGLSCMTCRIWSLIRESHVKPWAAEEAAHGGAAPAGNSALREAFSKPCMERRAVIPRSSAPLQYWMYNHFAT